MRWNVAITNVFLKQPPSSLNAIYAVSLKPKVIFIEHIYCIHTNVYMPHIMAYEQFSCLCDAVAYW
jgi:hypothetical protein